MKATEYRFWFGDGMGFKVTGSYIPSRVKAIHAQIQKYGDASCYLEIEQVECKVDGEWIEIENKGV